MAHSDNDHTAVQEEIFVCTCTVSPVCHDPHQRTTKLHVFEFCPSMSTGNVSLSSLSAMALELS
jgi:hypothetical protein